MSCKGCGGKCCKYDPEGNYPTFVDVTEEDIKKWVDAGIHKAIFRKLAKGNVDVSTDGFTIYFDPDINPIGRCPLLMYNGLCWIHYKYGYKYKPKQCREYVCAEFFAQHK